MLRSELTSTGVVVVVVVVVVTVPWCMSCYVDGPTSILGSLRASCTPLGADQSTGVPPSAAALSGLSATLGSPVGASSITPSLFTQLPTAEVLLHFTN